MQVYIVAVLVSTLLIIILFFALRSTVKRIDYNTKKYFVDKLQDYDYLIEEKKNVLDKLNEEIEKNKNVLNSLKENNIQSNNKEKQKYYRNSSVPKYIDKNLFENYKKIKTTFNFNYESLIKNFISNSITNKNDDYQILINIKNKFSNDEIYKIIGMKNSDQIKYINSILSENEIKAIEKNIDFNKFKIKNFITDLDTLIEKNDPTVYILTGDKTKNYDSISPIIKTKYSKNINEGIKISYKGILYDYSL